MAFDKVDHKLLDKIAFNGIQENFLCSFSSYVRNGLQRVVDNGYLSDLIYVTSGVPQGSILSPLLFFTFINHIKICIQYTNFLINANEFMGALLVILIVLWNDSDYLTHGYNTNNLKLNIPKCNSINFT